MNDSTKTLIINTITEGKYLQLSAAGKISNNQLFVVDNDDARRTVIASYDIVNQKLQDNWLSLSYDEIDGIKYIRLIDKNGNEQSKIDATEFLKDGTLNGIEYITTENGGGLQFIIKEDDSETTKSIIFVDSELLSTSTNAIQNKVVYDEIGKISSAASSYTDSEIEKLSVDTLYQRKTDSETSAAALDSRICSIEQDYLKASDRTELQGEIDKKVSLTALTEVAGALSTYADFMAASALTSANGYTDDLSDEIKTDLNELSETVSTICSDYALGSEVSSKDALAEEFKKYQLSGNYLSVAVFENRISDYALSSDVSSTFELSQKFTTVYTDISSVAEIYATSCVNKLSTEKTGGAAKTISKITETNGIVDAQFTDISIGKNQVNGLESELNGINNKFSDYYPSSQTSSSTELAEEFKKYQLSGNYLSVKTFEDTIKLSVETLSGEIISKTISITETTPEDYFKSYTISQGETQIGAINIPKDFLVKSGSVQTCDEDDKPVPGYIEGDKYLDFVVNVVSGEANDQHIYINVKDLTDIYQGTDGSEISVNVDANNYIGATIKTGAITKEKLSSSIYADISSIASSYAESSVNGLGIDDITGEASKTISKITENNGIVSAEFVRISIDMDQVSGLADKFDTYALSSNVSSATELSQKFNNYYTSSQTSSSNELSDEFKKYQLSGDYLSTTVFQEISSDHETRVQKLETDISNYAELSGNNRFTGTNTFEKDIILESNINIGDRISNVGDNTVAIGNDLTVGSYNFFWKGIDVNTNTSCATIYLTDKQPRYPYPFIITNGNQNVFKIFGKNISVDNESSYANLSAGNTYAANAYNCCTVEPWRDDYNQLCADYAAENPEQDGKNYRNDIAWIRGKLEAYMADAFSQDTNASVYLSGHETTLVGQQITMVNNDKIEYRRCGKVLDINGSILCVDIGMTYNEGKAYGHLTANGAKFHDFDFDDASLVFIDSPLLSGPSNVSQYSSINVGTKNIVLRRCSGAFGKDNSSESDFAFAMGRKAHALHYSTFVWAPANHISSTQPYTFNIGLDKNLNEAHNPGYNHDITIIGKDNKNERLYKYVWNCISCDPAIKTEQAAPLKAAVESIWSAISTYTVYDGKIKTADQLSVDDVMNAFHDMTVNLSTLWRSMNT